MTSATKLRRHEGFCGPSHLSNLLNFYITKQVPPDYMHAVLLGVTKKILDILLSSASAGKDYFVGKNVKVISSHMIHIKPPDYMERLPRDLEHPHNDLKATEYQA